MSDRTQQILDDLSGVKGQGFLLTIMLRNFAETLERSIELTGNTSELLADIERNPDGWLDIWGARLGLADTYMIYMVAAKTLLKEYVAEHMQQQSRKQLGGEPDGHV